MLNPPLGLLLGLSHPLGLALRLHPHAPPREGARFLDLGQLACDVLRLLSSKLCLNIVTCRRKGRGLR